MIDRTHSRGPVPIGAHAEALAAEQARLARIAAVYRWYVKTYGCDLVTPAGEDLQAHAIRAGWSSLRLWLELMATVEAIPELLDVQAAGPPATVCFQRDHGDVGAGPGRLFTIK